MRLIDADALKSKVNEIYNEELGHDLDWSLGLRFSKKIIDTMPTVDTTPIVRCIDCKFNGTMNCIRVLALGMNPADDWYCRDGLPKE